MKTSDLDKIHIKELRARCIVGINDWERVKRQDVVIDITLFADLSEACRTDNIDDTVDYKELKNRIVEFIEGSQFFLVERLTGAIAQLCLEDARVEKVTVALDKPGALRFARSVGIELTRHRDHDTKNTI